MTTSKVQELNIHEYSDEWPLVQLSRAGRLDLDQDIMELGAIVAGARRRPSGITVFRDAQGGFTDIALAAWAFERATALGRGQDWAPE